MRLLLSLFLFSMVSVHLVADTPATKLIHDDYTQVEHPQRKAIRGDWKIENGTASVTQDDALYKKYQNHGPIMVYEVPHDDATAEVVFKANGCKSVVFTMDGKAGGHAFRVRLSPATPGTVMTYEKKIGDEKAKPVILNRKLPTIKEGEWTTLKVKVVDDKATVTLHDTTVSVQHDQIDQEKKIAKLGFSFGSLAIKQFDLE